MCTSGIIIDKEGGRNESYINCLESFNGSKRLDNFSLSAATKVFLFPLYNDSDTKAIYIINYATKAFTIFFYATFASHLSLGAVYYLKNMCSFIFLKFNARDILLTAPAPAVSIHPILPYPAKGKLSHQMLVPNEL